MKRGFGLDDDDDDATFRNNIGLMDDGALPDFEEELFANYCVHYVRYILLSFGQGFGDIELKFPRHFLKIHNEAKKVRNRVEPSCIALKCLLTEMWWWVARKKPASSRILMIMVVPQRKLSLESINLLTPPPPSWPLVQEDFADSDTHYS